MALCLFRLNGASKIGAELGIWRRCLMSASNRLPRLQLRDSGDGPLCGVTRADNQLGTGDVLIYDPLQIAAKG
jgi:hypothetical protein